MPNETLTAQLAPRIAPVVLTNITTRYPYHDSHLFLEGEGPFDPAAAHPAFANSFDWHSSVHSHWTALRLVAHYTAHDTNSPVAAALRDAVARNFTSTNISAEAAYLAARPMYERPYGWAWAMRLAAEPGVPLEDLARQIAANALQWLEAMPAPVRHGVHGNTAFALGLMFDAARVLYNADLERAICERAREWFQEDRAYPADWERSAHDFLSPGLAEADLMRRVLPPTEFASWWRGFMSATDHASPIYRVAMVPSTRDGQIVHLHGLNLSRAGMLARIAASLRSSKPDATTAHDDTTRLLVSARQLYDDGVGPASDGEYVSTHWLPTFAWDAACSLDDASDAAGSRDDHRGNARHA
jgi:hypothetical protein